MCLTCLRSTNNRLRWGTIISATAKWGSLITLACFVVFHQNDILTRYHIKIVILSGCLGYFTPDSSVCLSVATIMRHQKDERIKKDVSWLVTHPVEVLDEQNQL